MAYDRIALKQEVRQNLRNTSPSARVVTLVYLLVFFALSVLVEVGRAPLEVMTEGLAGDLQWLFSMVQSGSVNEGNILGILLDMELGETIRHLVVFGGLFSLIAAVVEWILSFGYEGYCLSVIRRKNPGYTRLLCAFPKLGWVLLTAFLVKLFTALWAILIFTLAAIATVGLLLLMPGSWGVTLTIVVWLGAVAWMVSVSLRYVMADFILLDEKVDALEAISRSKAMMRGRKGHFFVLELSFIGWLLLAGLIGSVGAWLGLLLGRSSFAATVGSEFVLLFYMVWFQPYLMGSIAKFYNWMKHTDIENGVWEGRYPKHRAKQDTVKIAPIADPAQDAPDVPAYESPVSPAPAAPDVPEEVHVPDVPAEDVPDRPNYE